MKSRFLTLKPSGTRIQVVDAGKGGDLLYLHGAGGHMPADPLIAALATRYRVVAPLLPGYGQSTGEDGLRDMLDIALHGLDVLDALKLRKPIVVGHSMGGMIAAGLGVMEQQAGNLVGQLGEDVGDGMVVQPQAGRRKQAELRHLGAGDRRHLGRDHAAHGMADDDRLPELKGLQHVQAMQGDVEHVAQPLLALRPAVARQQGRYDPVLARQRCDQRIVGHEPTGAVQIEKVATFAGLDDLDADARRLDREKTRLHSAATLSGTGSFIGCTQKRSSWFFHSGHRSRRCGITLSANSLVE